MVGRRGWKNEWLVVYAALIYSINLYRCWGFAEKLAIQKTESGYIQISRLTIKFILNAQCIRIHVNTRLSGRPTQFRLTSLSFGATVVWYSEFKAGLSVITDGVIARIIDNLLAVDLSPCLSAFTDRMLCAICKNNSK